MKKKKIIKVFSAFAGFDTQFIALLAYARWYNKNTNGPLIEFVLVGWCEIDKDAIASHNALFPEAKNCHYNQFTLVEIFINILYISVDGTVYVIITTAIDVIALLNSLFALVPQFGLYTDSRAEVYTIAAMCHSKTKSVLVSPTGFNQGTINVVDINPMSCICFHVYCTASFRLSSLYGHKNTKQNKIIFQIVRFPIYN